MIRECVDLHFLRGSLQSVAWQFTRQQLIKHDTEGMNVGAIASASRGEILPPLRSCRRFTPSTNSKLVALRYHSGLTCDR